MRKIAVFFILFLPAFLCFPALPLFSPVGGTVAAGNEIFAGLEQEEPAGSPYFYMVNEKGRTILITGHRLRAKDRYLTAENDLYEVESVEGYLARARLIRRVRLIDPPGFSAGPSTALPVQSQVRPAYKIALYHTHNAESYVPSDGTDTIYGAGGIHEVGQAFKEALEKKGVTVVYSDQLHLPHDRGAYRRSRVTALNLLRQRPDAIFDVHRDAAPWETYALELEGEPVTQIQIVVGLSNPGTAANQQFAYDLKGYADRLCPGLIHGVLTIWGSYNQDLSPLSLLLEVGAHTNTRESAERGIAHFADVVSYYFYGPAFLKDRKIAPAPPKDAPAARQSYGIMHAFSGTVISLLLASLGGAVGFYFLNNPGALKEFYLWWGELPRRAAVLARQTRLYFRSLPGLSKTIRQVIPSNLRRAWRMVKLERRIAPRLIRALVKRLLSFAGQCRSATVAFWKEAPQNLKQAWKVLHHESRLLPRRMRDAIDVLKSVLRRLLSRAALILRQSGERLNQTRAEAKAEGEELLGLFREIIFLLRSRLKP